MKKDLGNIRKDLQQAGPSDETLSGASKTQGEEDKEDLRDSFCVTLPCNTFVEFDLLEAELKHSKAKKRDMVSSNFNVYDECSRLACSGPGDPTLYLDTQLYVGFTRPAFSFSAGYRVKYPPKLHTLPPCFQEC